MIERYQLGTNAARQVVAAVHFSKEAQNKMLDGILSAPDRHCAYTSYGVALGFSAALCSLGVLLEEEVKAFEKRIYDVLMLRLLDFEGGIELESAARSALRRRH